MISLAFTCTGSYAILIMLGIKRVENRSVMPVPSKGRCAASCSTRDMLVGGIFQLSPAIIKAGLSSQVRKMSN